MTLTFTISIAVLGVAAFFGGMWLKRSKPRTVAVVGGFLYGSGVILASFSDKGLWWLYVTYGVIGGAGLGISVYCACSRACEMVSGATWPDHWDSGWRVRCRCFSYSADCDQTHSTAWSAFYLRLSGSCIPRSDSGCRPVSWRIHQTVGTRKPPSSTAMQVQRSTHDYSLREALGTVAVVGSVDDSVP